MMKINLQWLMCSVSALKHVVIYLHIFLLIFQVVILVIIPKMDGPVSLTTKDMLKFVILCQYIPRFFRIYPLFNEVTRSSGLFAETAWAGAAINLFLYMLASHVSLLVGYFTVVCTKLMRNNWVVLKAKVHRRRNLSSS